MVVTQIYINVIYIKCQQIAVLMVRRKSINLNEQKQVQDI